MHLTKNLENNYYEIFKALIKEIKQREILQNLPIFMEFGIIHFTIKIIMLPKVDYRFTNSDQNTNDII